MLTWFIGKIEAYFCKNFKMLKSIVIQSIEYILKYIFKESHKYVNKIICKWFSIEISVWEIRRK